MPHTPSEQAWLRQLPSPSVASTSCGVQPGTALITPSCLWVRGKSQNVLLHVETGT